MTANEAVASLDAMVKNNIENTEKVKWLLALDGKYYLQMMEPYSIQTDEDNTWHTAVVNAAHGQTVTVPAVLTEPMLIPYPFADIYETYLLSRLYLATSEPQRFAAASSMFEREWNALGSRIARSYKIRCENRLHGGAT